jgi:BarA-like signal transduction histidine kinase
MVSPSTNKIVTHTLNLIEKNSSNIINRCIGLTPQLKLKVTHSFTYSTLIYYFTLLVSVGAVIPT